jgi:hypothetical protein
MRNPKKLDPDERCRLQALLDRCSELNALAGHVRAFAEMIGELRGDRLDEWMERIGQGWPLRWSTTLRCRLS